MATAPFAFPDAEWLAHRYVESEDRVRFVRVPRGRHAEIPFLTDARLGDTGPTHELPAAECLRDAHPGPTRFVFHSAFCGSTMLVRAFDRPGLAMGLSEPVILNDVVGFRRRGAEPRAVARTADLAARLLARPFGANEAVVIKPSNVVNPLAELLLALRGEARAIFLFAPLETFLLSVARKGLECRLWVRELAEGYLAEGYLAPLGFGPAELFRQTDLQIAAIGWLAQQLHFTRLAAKIGVERLRFLDSETMTANPAAAVAGVAAHFGLNLGEGEAAEIGAGPAFTRHSKTGGSYSAADRGADYAAARSAYGEEIAMVLVWAEKVAEAVGVALTPSPDLRIAQS